MNAIWGKKVNNAYISAIAFVQWTNKQWCQKAVDLDATNLNNNFDKITSQLKKPN